MVEWGAAPCIPPLTLNLDWKVCHLERHASHTLQRVMVDLALWWEEMDAKSLPFRLENHSNTSLMVEALRGMRDLGQVGVLTKVEATWWR